MDRCVEEVACDPEVVTDRELPSLKRLAGRVNIGNAASGWRYEPVATLYRGPKHHPCAIDVRRKIFANWAYRIRFMRTQPRLKEVKPI